MTTLLGSIQIAQKTKAAWDVQNPTLKWGQLAAVTDGGKTFLKAGDEVTGWAALKYITVKDTDVVAEGISNLYFTNDRVEAYVNPLYYKKSVVDGMFADAVKTPLPIDCSANPNYPAGTKGTSYKVSHAGKIGGASGEVVNVGDLLILNINSAGGTQAAVGANWGIYQSNLDKSSETIFGTSRRATTAELTAGTDDEAYVTSSKFRVAADARFLKLTGGDLSGAFAGTSAKMNGRIFSTGIANYGDLLTTNGALVMSFDQTAQEGYLASYNYLTTLPKPLLINASAVTILGSLFLNTTSTHLRMKNGTTEWQQYVASGGGFVTFGNTNSGFFIYTNSQERVHINGSGFFNASSTGAMYGAGGGSYHSFQSAAVGNNVMQIAHMAATGAYGPSIYLGGANFNNAINYFLGGADLGGTRMYLMSNGGIHGYSANNVNLSDRTVKKNINPVGSLWEMYKALEVVDFEYIDQTHDDPNLGVIAQQVLEVAPRFVNTDGWGETAGGKKPLLSVYETDMWYGLLRVVQEGMSRIEKLEYKTQTINI